MIFIIIIIYMIVFAAAIHPDCHHAQLWMEKEKEEELKEKRTKKGINL